MVETLSDAEGSLVLVSKAHLHTRQNFIKDSGGIRGVSRTEHRRFDILFFYYKGFLILWAGCL